ncbi:tRNA (adenine(22)-N(1))-methyltransferase [Bacillus methanolicus]|uniref:tRNA (Adenine(22)-N(1))-methyltransferase n=1 Tax=Bacillus methanolicus (strain MGA3 / ATCC 53907) TaxID=796606 RepID=I3EAL0_BACMM|nr:tRNA (adenine(22)-N(1))-methyltransferase TrmK [Bacillus methanolicus]AIE60770.1 tRNA (adenine(22)-N(1))-methyltransferase [Bacillus methanolicus MGA3]EIJ83531.1 putative SAM-dependent methyltransferase [Bacillus methanolicus MGA3]UQD52780.1 tRNA (adenine(22)-N(1))-methyltransferase TrmK [Bacillus methanolicus]
MNTINLSKRLQTVAHFIPMGSRLADIGSDHAYLPCHAVKKGIVTFAIAGEVADGPYQSALKQVQTEGLTNNIFVRKGDGLEVVEPGEVDCVTIAGMGGTLIANILERGKEKLTDVKRLILQPNIGAISIRKWLLENGWMLISEEILEEDGKIYEVLAAEKGDPYIGYEENLESGLLLGPLLQIKQNEPFRKKWTNEKDNWKRILRQLEQAGDKPEIRRKKEELLHKISLVEEALGRK